MFQSRANGEAISGPTSVGSLTSKGLITADQVTTIIGALGGLFGVAWGLFVKSGTKAVPEATAARSDVPTVSGATGAVQR